MPDIEIGDNVFNNSKVFYAASPDHIPPGSVVWISGGGLTTSLPKQQLGSNILAPCGVVVGCVKRLTEGYLVAFFATAGTDPEYVSRALEEAREKIEDDDEDISRWEMMAP